MVASTWRCAASDVRWNARPAKNHVLPKTWGAFDASGTLLLKDTRSKYWKNRLVAPNKFIYSFPKCDKNTSVRALVHRIRTRVTPDAPLCVHLFSTPGSRNEFYGEWVVSEIVHDTPRTDVSELVLSRLVTQHAAVADAYAADPTAHRSKNETWHATVLDNLFPEPRWIVRHEPETLLDLHDLSVVDGVAKDVCDLTSSYTCDFVVASKDGCQRLCVESKPSAESVTEEALVKCRILRDRTFSRVVFLVGSHALRWLDMGPPGCTPDQERWHDDLQELLPNLF